MLHVTRGSMDRSTQESYNHLAAYNKRMAMFAVIFRNYRPGQVVTGKKCRLEKLNRLRLRRRPVHQSDDGGVTAIIQDALQSDQQGAELPLLGIRIDRKKCGLSIRN